VGRPDHMSCSGAVESLQTWCGHAMALRLHRRVVMAGWFMSRWSQRLDEI
jgi:hypothetical protein